LSFVNNRFYNHVVSLTHDEAQKQFFVKKILVSKREQLFKICGLHEVK